MSMVDDTRYRSESSSDPYRSAEDGARDGAPDAAADPLTELARLIGQSDPFADLKGRRASALRDGAESDVRPAPEWLARASSAHRDEPEPERDGYAPAPYSPYDTSFRAAAEEQPDAYAASDEQYRAAEAEQDHYAHDRYAPAEYADGAEADPAADNPYRVTPPAADYDGDGYYDDGHLPPRADDDGLLAGRRRGGLVTIAAVLGLAVIGTAGAFAYRAYTGPAGDTPPPVIKADPTPVKSPPPASTATDTQNKPIQDRVGAATPVQTERIVPREEPPMAVPAAPAPGAPAAVTAFAPPPTPAPAAPSPNEPKRVRTVTIRQQQTGDTTATATPQPAPTTAPGTPAAPHAAAPKQPQRNTPLALAPQATDPAPAPNRRSAATDGAYVVQVSAQKTESEAQSSYRALQQKYPAVLGSREANIRRADLGDKGVYYRAQIGPFATADQANEFCTNLKSAGGQCIVQKN